MDVIPAHRPKFPGTFAEYFSSLGRFLTSGMAVCRNAVLMTLIFPRCLEKALICCQEKSVALHCKSSMCKTLDFLKIDIVMTAAVSTKGFI